MLSKRSFCLCVILAGLLVGQLGGCTGGGEVKIVPMMRKDFAPGEALIGSVPISEAYHWINDDGTLNVALRHRRRSLLGRAFDFDWQMSLVLEGMPAGRERLYEVRDRLMRMVSSQGGNHQRARSVFGIVVIEVADGGGLKGRFHVWSRQQAFGVLTGWAPPINRAPMQLVVGRFESVPNAEAGRKILEQTEADGFERNEDDLPATQGVRWLGSAPAGVSASAPASCPADD